MKIVISGASGKTGYRVAEEALKQGHEVKLLLRKNSILPKELRKCEKEIISLNNSLELDKSLINYDTLVIATGARPSVDLTGPARVDALGVIRQIKSCQRVGLKRVILVSSLCAGKLLHPLNLFGLILIWKRIGETNLENSSLDWTIIRPGGLTEKESDIVDENVIYTAMNTQEEGSIPRRLVAKCCIEAMNTIESIGKIVEITSNKVSSKQTMKKAINSFPIPLS